MDQLQWEKNAISAKSMFIIVLNQNAIELVAYASFLIKYVGMCKLNNIMHCQKSLDIEI